MLRDMPLIRNSDYTDSTGVQAGPVRIFGLKNAFRDRWP
jgi:hypothetical protein